MKNGRIIHTCLSPELIYLYDMEDTVAVVIDVLRATSTIAALIQMGVAKVIPVTSVEQCIQVGKDLECITAGELNGKILPGLQKGNSPLDFSFEEVKYKTVAITTTNGTMLFNELILNGAHLIITGAFVNLSIVCDYIISQGKNVLLACAGWKGLVNCEDTLFAGAVVNRIQSYFTHRCDSSIVVDEFYKSCLSYDSLLEFMKLNNTSHYKRLFDLHHEDDLQRCFDIDYYSCLPRYLDGALIRHGNDEY